MYEDRLAKGQTNFREEFLKNQNKQTRMTSTETKPSLKAPPKKNPNKRWKELFEKPTDPVVRKTDTAASPPLSSQKIHPQSPLQLQKVRTMTEPNIQASFVESNHSIAITESIVTPQTNPAAEYIEYNFFTTHRKSFGQQPTTGDFAERMTPKRSTHLDVLTRSPSENFIPVRYSPDKIHANYGNQDQNRGQALTPKTNKFEDIHHQKDSLQLSHYRTDSYSPHKTAKTSHFRSQSENLPTQPKSPTAVKDSFDAFFKRLLKRIPRSDDLITRTAAYSTNLSTKSSFYQQNTSASGKPRAKKPELTLSRTNSVSSVVYTSSPRLQPSFRITQRKSSLGK